MRKSKEQIHKEKIAVYFGMIGVMRMHDVDYCQSWWLNTKNYNIGLTTPEINRRAKLLVKQGLLSIDKSKTSNSCGVCYRLTKLDDINFDMLTVSKSEYNDSFSSIDTLQTE